MRSSNGARRWAVGNVARSAFLDSMLHRVGAREFLVDIPFKPFPISWQDTGSSVFTFATASMLLGATPAARTGRHRPPVGPGPAPSGPTTTSNAPIPCLDPPTSMSRRPSPANRSGA